MRILLPLSVMCALVVFLTACDESLTGVTSVGQPFYADQHYYPLTEGTYWQYRIDTTGASGPTIRDVARRIVRMKEIITIDSVDYTLQINETISGTTNEFDTVYVRKDDSGVYVSSPSLRRLSLLPGLPGGTGFPKEFMVIALPPESQNTWSIINFEYNQIPFFPIYFRVSATYLGMESVMTDFKTFKECARIRVNIDARLPNLENPQDLLNPLIIKENASFWFARPFGLIVSDGAEIVFNLLSGQIAFSQNKRRIRHEVIGFDIVQPSYLCKK